jgi:hypothetical protein
MAWSFGDFDSQRYRYGHQEGLKKEKEQAPASFVAAAGIRSESAAQGEAESASPERSKGTMVTAQDRLLLLEALRSRIYGGNSPQR